MTPQQITTFKDVSGISPGHLDLIFRMGVGGALTIWSLYMCVAFIHHLKKQRGSALEVIQRLFRVGIVMMVGLILIAYR